MAARWKWAGGAVLGLGLLVVGAGAWLVKSDRGRDRLARTIVDAANGVFAGRGRLEIGELRSVLPGGLDARNVRLVDTLGEPILTAARVRGELAVRNLLDGVVRISSLELDSVRLDLRRDATGPFNLLWLISGDPDAPPGPERPPGLGDNVRIESLVLRHGELVVTAPWEPHPLFTGSERDSVIAVRDSLHDLIRRDGTLFERRRVSIAELRARDVHAVTPDDAPGRLTLLSAQLRVSDPPVIVRDVRGNVQWYPDSLTFDADSIALPASRLAARGSVTYGLPGPVRYDVRIDGREVALADINWTWPVLPPDGSAQAQVHLRTLENPDHLAVTLTALDASAMDSRVRGELTMVAEVKDFLLRDVAMEFEPLTTALASRLTEDALPPELDGRITGRFVAREGGSLSALRIDTLRMAFLDAVVPGATSRLRASGVVGLGVNPTARDVRLSDVSVDLRSVRAVVPDLPAIVNGVVSGSARLASASLDAADVGDLMLTWTDEAGNVSAVTGRSAVRWGGRTMRADVALDFERIDLAAFARLDTAFVGRGVLQAQLEADGALDSLPLLLRIAQRDVASGAVRAEGWVGMQPPRGDSTDWRADLTVQLDSLDAAPWLAAAMAPSTRLGGTLRLAGRGTNGVVDTATVSAAIEQPASESRTPFALFAAGNWGREALRMDSVLARMPGVLLEGSGGLARDSAGRETFRASVRIDTLERVRAELPRLARTIAQVDTALAATVRSLAEDSLSGDVNVSVYGEGSFRDYLTSVAVAGQQVRVGDVVVGQLFGSFRADNLPRAARFVAAATADSVEGIGALRIATINAGVDDASATGGALRMDVVARDTSRLRLRGRFARNEDTLAVESDSVRFTYGDVVWTNESPLVLRDRPDGFRIDTFALTSNRNGSLRLAADVPLSDPIEAFLRLDRFPAGELAAFALGTQRLPGLVSGTATLRGVRQDPTLVADFTADSLGTTAATLSGVRLQADYSAQQLVARVSVSDTLQRSLRASLQLPADLRLQEVVGERIYTEALEGEVVADSLRLRDLPLRLADVRDLDGYLHGRIALGGTFDRPSIEGRMQLDGGTLFSDVLGIRPQNAQLTLLAGGDSLTVERFRFRSGERPGDTLHLTATVRRPLRDDPAVTMRATLSNVALARQRDGTDLDLSGTVQVSGRFPRPVVSADLFVPSANLVLDLTEARTVLDLNSQEARALLDEDELPVVASNGEQFTSLGEYLDARDVRVRLGNDVWVRTREAAVKLAGGVTVLEAAGQRLSLDGEVEVQRGTYRLDLGVVNRPFQIDSGRIRFFPQDTLNPALDIRARYVVRGVDGRDVPIDVTIGGTLDDPTLALSTPDDAYASAPESEFISLLVFGAPTFALDGQSQQTVRAVTGVLLPTFSNVVEGGLQRLLPVFNTVQVNTAGGQSGEQLGALSFLDNLSVTAGKQIGARTYLRLDTGVCRSLGGSAAARSLDLWYGVAVEYRIAPTVTGQVGVDPGPSPCGAQSVTGSSRRMQVGFDLFKEWVF